MGRTDITWIVAGWIFLGLLVFVLLLFVSAPYGRHTRKGWGITIPNRWGWLVMEIPSLLCFSLFFIFGPGDPAPVTWVFFICWTLHYGHRSLIFPFLTRTRGKKMPLLIALFAVFFNLVNGSLNGFYLSNFKEPYQSDWVFDPRFIGGMIIFLTGAVINIRSDYKLLRLRKKSGRGYSIPRGGMFRWISCPNFFGEIIEWSGFALMVWNPAGLAFALWTIFNLLPRALEHHRWYREHFDDYPAGRKALIPWLL